MRKDESTAIKVVFAKIVKTSLVTVTANTMNPLITRLEMEEKTACVLFDNLCLQNEISVSFHLF